MEASLCSGFSTSEWKRLKERLEGNDNDAWLLAIGVLERRMTERFFSCIDALFAADTKPDMSPSGPARRDHCIPGFAIMALCCLLIETLQGFLEEPAPTLRPAGPCAYPTDGKCIKSPAGTTEQFKRFLQLPAFGENFRDETIAGKFVKGIRNGILHEAETRKWVIWRAEPSKRIVEAEQNGLALNRTLFYQAVKKEFETYLKELRQPCNVALRQRFKKKMDDIVRET